MLGGPHREARPSRDNADALGILTARWKAEERPGPVGHAASGP